MSRVPSFLTKRLQHGRFDGEGAGDRDPLALPAGELAHELVALTGERDELQQLVGAAAALRPRLPAHPEPEADVLPHLHEREQREVLKDERGRAPVGSDAPHVLAADPHEAVGGLDEARHGAKDGRLAAAGGTEEREELAPLDLEVGVAHGHEVAEAHGDVLQLHVVRHRRPPLSSGSGDGRGQRAPAGRARPAPSGRAAHGWIYAVSQRVMYSPRSLPNQPASGFHHQRFAIASPFGP